MSVQETFGSGAEISARPGSSVRTGPAYSAAKRTLDVLIGLFALAFLLPLLLIIAIFIKLDSPGPIFFRQRRSGLNDRPFEIFKLRTMRVCETESVAQVVENDPRVTAVGRILRTFSLDELPQFINVVRGEMALVGPRPHACVHDDEYSQLISGYRHRYAVKPGLTGWAQIHGLRGPTPTVDAMRRRVELDIWYATHASFALDLKIMLLTPREIVRPRNAF